MSSYSIDVRFGKPNTIGLSGMVETKQQALSLVRVLEGLKGHLEPKNPLRAHVGAGWLFTGLEREAKNTPSQ